MADRNAARLQGRYGNLVYPPPPIKSIPILHKYNIISWALLGSNSVQLSISAAVIHFIFLSPILLFLIKLLIMVLLICAVSNYKNITAQPCGRTVKSYALPMIIMRLICAVAMTIKLTFLIVPLLHLNYKKKRISTVICLT